MSRIRVIAALALVTAALVAVPTPVRAAATLFVDKDHPGPCDDSTADSSVIPFCTIQAAVNAASDTDTIEIAAGTYTSGASPIASINKILTINGAGIGLTIIDGEDLRQGLVFGSSAQVTVADLTIRNGAATTGGGINTSASFLALDSVAFEGNNATSGGGALFLTPSADYVEITESTFDDNHDTGTIGIGGGGGAIGGPSPGGTTLVVTNSEFTGNTAVAHGGAIKAFLTGGVTVAGSTFSNNSTTGGNGGAVAFHALGGTFTITDSVFEGNSSLAGGAATFASGEHTVVSSYFALNTASGAGGGVNQDDSTGTLAIVNSTFYDNEATGSHGGGGFVHNGLVLNSTFSHNHAGGDGGGLARGATGVHVANTILANNTANSAPDCHDITSEGHNLIEDDTGCVLDGDETGNITGLDPLLFLPADFGGSNPTMRPPLSSPAVDAGNPAVPGGPWVFDAGDWTCTLTDQRGESRTDGRCDIGAYEESRVVRYSGADRYATAAEIVAEDFPNFSGGTVLIATGLNFPDGLAASAIAPALGAPLLLVSGSGVPAATAAELTRLQPSAIWVIGGPAAISDDIVGDLEAFAPSVLRVFGANRYATAIAMSQAVFPDDSVSTVYIATGSNFPDALAAGPAAAFAGGPVLLVPGTQAELPADVAAEIIRLSPDEIVVAGGTAAVSPGIFSDLEDLQVGDTVMRISGADRYATAVAIADHAFTTGSGRVYLATGTNFPDALAGAAAAGKYDSPVLLVPGTSIPGGTEAEITAQAPAFGIVLGGTAVISEDVFIEFLVIVID